MRARRRAKPRFATGPTVGKATVLLTMVMTMAEPQSLLADDGQPAQRRDVEMSLAGSADWPATIEAGAMARVTDRFNGLADDHNFANEALVLAVAAVTLR